MVKLLFHNIFMLAIILFMTSCGGKETEFAIKKEQSRKDSLEQINKKILHDMSQMMAQHYSDVESVIKETEDSVRTENRRTQREYEIYQKEQERIKYEEEQRRKEEERRRKEEEEKGPRWLDGSWNITTRFHNPFNGQTYLVKGSLLIDWEKQHLVCVTISYPDNERETVVGYYKVTRNLDKVNFAITCKGQYWEIDERNHRIGFGNGDYYTKEN